MKYAVKMGVFVVFGCTVVAGGFFGGKWFAVHQDIKKNVRAAEVAQQEARRVPIVVTQAAVPAEVRGSTPPQVAPAMAGRVGAFNLGIPFISQAPRKQWDAQHEDYCEESALLMAVAFFSHAEWDIAEQERRLQELYEWELKTFGHFESTSVAEVVRIAQEFLKFRKVLVLNQPSYEQIRRETEAGRLVLVPTNGRALFNPHFKNGGPGYHMVVVRGFTERGDFITNDPGTQYGENFVYKKDILMSAIHDWDHAPTEKINATGAAKIIVIE